MTCQTHTTVLEAGGTGLYSINARVFSQATSISLP